MDSQGITSNAIKIQREHPPPPEVFEITYESDSNEDWWAVSDSIVIAIGYNL